MAEEDKQLNNKVWNVVIIFVGMIVLVIHLLLYSYSKDVFNVIISLYVIAFAILFIVFLQKKKKFTSDAEYNFLTYTCLFVLCIEVMVLFVSIFSIFSNGPHKYSGYNRY